MSIKDLYEYIQGETQNIVDEPQEGLPYNHIRAFKHRGISILGNNITICLDEGGINPLVEGVDYTVELKDLKLSSLETVNVFGGYKLVTSAHENTILYLHMRVYGGYSKYTGGKYIELSSAAALDIPSFGYTVFADMSSADYTISLNNGTRVNDRISLVAQGDYILTVAGSGLTSQAFSKEARNYVWSGATWVTVSGGGGSGSGSSADYYNYIKNPLFDIDALDWNSSNAGLTLSLENTEPIFGKNSLKVSKAASDLNGESFYTDFSAEGITLSDLVQISFNMKISDLAHKDDWKVNLLDTGATNTLVSKNIIPEFNSNGIASISFLVPTEADADMRLQFALNSTDGDIYDLIIDNVFVGKPSWFTVSDNGNVEFISQSAVSDDAGSILLSATDADVNGKDRDGNLVIGGQHVYLITEYPELWENSSTPRSDYIVGCDTAGTGAADGIHFKTIEEEGSFKVVTSNITMKSNTNYIVTSDQELTLPSSSLVGDTIKIISDTATTTIKQPNANTIIYYRDRWNTTSGTTGSLELKQDESVRVTYSSSAVDRWIATEFEVKIKDTDSGDGDYDTRII